MDFFINVFNSSLYTLYLRYYLQPVSTNLADYVAEKQESLKVLAEEYMKDAQDLRSISNSKLANTRSMSILVITAPRSSPTGYLVRVLAQLHRQAQVSRDHSETK